MLTSEQQRSSPHLLIGFCDHHQEWYKFSKASGSRNCPDCGGSPSQKIGYQITTQRSFDLGAKKLTKAQLKKMGGIGA